VAERGERAAHPAEAEVDQLGVEAVQALDDGFGAGDGGGPLAEGGTSRRSPVAPLLSGIAVISMVT
jgi:hypothetical protein